MASTSLPALFTTRPLPTSSSTFLLQNSATSVSKEIHVRQALHIFTPSFSPFCKFNWQFVWQGKGRAGIQRDITNGRPFTSHWVQTSSFRFLYHFLVTEMWGHKSNVSLTSQQCDVKLLLFVSLRTVGRGWDWAPAPYKDKSDTAGH